MNLLIIQARMGSTRFPGKVLAKIEDTPILKIIVDRVCASKYADQIVVATTENNEDDCLETFCDNNGINVFRGSDWDVLDRFYNACLTISPKPKNIIRVCSDNPLLSCYEVDYVFNAFLNSGMAYFSNSNQEPNFLEDGFDVEVFTFNSLKSAWQNAKLLSEREHVCPYIKSNFESAWKKVDGDYRYKLSVDTIDDFLLVKEIFKEFTNHSKFNIHDVVKLLKNKPQLLKINKNSKINSGYLKSLRDDRIVEK